METVPISKFKATCLALLERVRTTGEPLLVTRRGEPVAEIIPPPRPDLGESWLGKLRGTGVIKGDVVSPASDDEWKVLQP
jgi:prevent-host-death family protein